MHEDVVAVRNLSRRFGSKTVLNDVSLGAPRGSVFGLVGENGAGKTTLIKHVLGLLRAEAGSVRVFGIDPVADPVSVLGRIGYLSEQPDLPGWMRVDELIRYTQAFYPKWDTAYAEEMREQFGLDRSARITVRAWWYSLTGTSSAFGPFRPLGLYRHRRAAGLESGHHQRSSRSDDHRQRKEAFGELIPAYLPTK
jgi:ABC-type glutathione transport system ATPase component